MQISWHDGVRGLVELRGDWLSLHGTAHLFARYEWNLATTENLVPDASEVSFCRIAETTGRAVAIVSVITSPLKIGPLGIQPGLTLGLHSHLTTFDFPLSADADVAAVGAAMYDAFRNFKRRWTVVRWRRVMTNSNAMRVASALPHSRVVLRPSSPCNTVDTARPAEELLATLPNNLRGNLRKLGRRLAQEGDTRVHFASADGDFAAAFDEFLRIESSGWKGGSGTMSAIAYRPEAQAFYESLLRQQSADFEPDIALLVCGQTAIAASLLIRTARWLHVYKIGYDESFRKFSPGNILLWNVLEKACASAVIDRVSLVTSFPWHAAWRPIPEPTMDVLIFQDAWRPPILQLALVVHARVRAVQRRYGGAPPADSESA